MSFTITTTKGTYRGDNRALLQSVSRKSSPVNGYTEEATYRGFSAWAFQELADYMYRNGFEYEWDTQHGIHTLRAVDTSGAITIDTWEIALNKASPSIYKNPVTIQAIIDGDGMTYDNAVKVLTDIASVESGSGITVSGKAVNTYEALYAGYISAGLNASARVLKLIHQGTDSYYASGYVLRHTTNVPARSSYNIADVGVDQIYSTAMMLSEATNAGLWRYPLPWRLQIKAMAIDSHFQSLYNSGGVNQANYLWGWLKSGATETTAANNRVNIVTEYDFFNWSLDVYYAYP